MLFPYNTSPIKLTSRSYPLINNITSNVATGDVISGNIINTVPDHLSMLLILLHHSITPNSKQNLCNNTLEISVGIFIGTTKKINK